MNKCAHRAVRESSKPSDIPRFQAMNPCFGFDIVLPVEGSRGAAEDAGRRPTQSSSAPLVHNAFLRLICSSASRKAAERIKVLGRVAPSRRRLITCGLQLGQGVCTAWRRSAACPWR